MLLNQAWIILFLIKGMTRLVTCDMFLDLKEKLFHRYDPGIRPHCGSGEGRTNVTIDVALRQILYLNEPTQEIKIKVWMRLFWKDCRLTWNQTEFKTDSLYLPRDRVWIPDISLFDSTNDEALPGIKDYRAKITYDGSMQYQWPTVITSYCKLNVRHFPLDSQTCAFIFTSWIYNGDEIDLDSIKEDGYADMQNYQENAAWIVTSFHSKKTVTYYNCCKEPFTDMRYYLNITRRHLNYIVTLVFPCLLISFLPLLGFLLPVSYGEKVSLQVTMMLSLAVFLMVITTSLPPSSDDMPLLGIYFVGSLSLVGASCVMTVMVINIHFKSKRSVYPWVRKYMIGKVGKLLLVESGEHNEVESIQRPLLALEKGGLDIHYAKQKSEQYDDGVREKFDSLSSSIRTVIKQLHVIERRIQEDESEAARANEWHLLAIVVDRVFFILCFIFLFVILILCFPESEESHHTE